MKPVKVSTRNRRCWGFIPPVVALSTMAALLLATNGARAGGVVTNCTESDLRAAMLGGSAVTFACDGTITLSNTLTIATNTILEASGHKVLISGGNLVRVLQVNTNATLTLIHLTIANGSSTNGGGIYIAGGSVNATSCAFCDNYVQGFDRSGLYDGGNGGDACGGAIYNRGSLNASRCAFLSNRASGGSGSDWLFLDIYGISGGRGGEGYGGAICNVGTMVIENSLLAFNTAGGGSGGDGGDGNYSGGDGGSGGCGSGAAIFGQGAASMVNCTFAWNSSGGGDGGEGGIYHCYDCDEYAEVGANGPGGGAGGAISGGTGVFWMTNCTVVFNSGTAGLDGGSSSRSASAVGGLDVGPAGVLVNTILARACIQSGKRLKARNRNELTCVYKCGSYK
jgi:hypothetical protein